MNIILCYGYHPHTTAVYLERALQREHNVHWVGTPGWGRAGYASNQDLSELIDAGTVPKPDLVLFAEGTPFFPRGLEKLDCITAGYVIDVHSTFWVRENYAPFFDHLFVCHKDYVARFEELGYPSVHWMPVGCDPEIHGELPSERIYDIGFVGSLDVHPERKRLLLELSRHFSTNDFRRAYPKEDLARIYSQSKIAFNYAINKDVNMRVFEALAAGALLLTNRMENGMSDLLRRGEHFVEYADERELLEQVAYYLSHEDERRRIAESGQRAVLHDHTYAHRCRGLIATATATSAPQRTARVRTMSAPELRRAYGHVYSMQRLADAAFDEFATAWRQNAGQLAATKALAVTLLKRFNGITRASQLIRRPAQLLDLLGRRRTGSEDEAG